MAAEELAMQAQPTSPLPTSVQRVLITGGAVVRHLLQHSQAQVFNLDKLGYASG